MKDREIQERLDRSLAFGSYMPLRLESELNFFSRPLRLPGFVSESFARETLLGEDEDIGFEDYLGGFIFLKIFNKLKKN